MMKRFRFARLCGIAIVAACTVEVGHGWVMAPFRSPSPASASARATARPGADVHCNAFHRSLIAPTAHSYRGTDRATKALGMLPKSSIFGRQRRSSHSRVVLNMYDLPPGGGGGRNKLGEVAKTVLTIALTVAFFLSPIGGFVLNIFNSFLVLIFVLPLVGMGTFQVWRYFNMIDGTCPNCGSPVSVLKSKADQPDQVSMCLNCGAAVQSSPDNQQIVNVSGRNSINDLEDVGPFGGGGASIFDLFSGDGINGYSDSVTTTTTTVITETFDETPKRKRRPSDSTIIDVDSSEVGNDKDKDDWRPWQ